MRIGSSNNTFKKNTPLKLTHKHTELHDLPKKNTRTQSKKATATVRQRWPSSLLAGRRRPCFEENSVAVCEGVKRTQATKLYAKEREREIARESNSAIESKTKGV